MSARFKLIWRTQNVLILAETIRKNKNYDQMPILADALMDAGCEAKNIIRHCHKKHPCGHGSPCWLLGVILDQKSKPKKLKNIPIKRPHTKDIFERYKMLFALNPKQNKRRKPRKNIRRRKK